MNGAVSLPAENSGIVGLGCSFLWWVMAAARGRGSAKGREQQHQTNKDELMKRRLMNEWEWMNQFIFSLQRGPAWRAAGWCAEWSEINWNYEIDWVKWSWRNENLLNGMKISLNGAVEEAINKQHQQINHKSIQRHWFVWFVVCLVELI